MFVKEGERHGKLLSAVLRYSLDGMDGWMDGNDDLVPKSGLVKWMYGMYPLYSRYSL